jgi:hypothetical protein
MGKHLQEITVEAAIRCEKRRRSLSRAIAHAAQNPGSTSCFVSHYIRDTHQMFKEFLQRCPKDLIRESYSVERVILFHNGSRVMFWTAKSFSRNAKGQTVTLSAQDLEALALVGQIIVVDK